MSLRDSPFVKGSVSTLWKILVMKTVWLSAYPSALFAVSDRVSPEHSFVTVPAQLQRENGYACDTSQKGKAIGKNMLTIGKRHVIFTAADVSIVQTLKI
jgi:hypothetical protein